MYAYLEFINNKASEADLKYPHHKREKTTTSDVNFLHYNNHVTMYM